MTSETALVRYVNSNDANGYYKALGLSPDATREQIRVAYYKLVKRLHPDRGGDEELFRFVVEVADVLLDAELKTVYDSVGVGAIYLGSMEREQLARSGLLDDQHKRPAWAEPRQYWACVTTSGFSPGEDTNAWVDFCRQVSSAVGYHGRVRVAVLEGGQHWPFDQSSPWGIATAGSHTFVVFQKGIEPNRLHALCAMIDWQNHLLKQSTDRKKPTWL